MNAILGGLKSGWLMSGGLKSGGLMNGELKSAHRVYTNTYRRRAALAMTTYLALYPHDAPIVTGTIYFSLYFLLRLVLVKILFKSIKLDYRKNIKREQNSSVLKRRIFQSPQTEILVR